MPIQKAAKRPLQVATFTLASVGAGVLSIFFSRIFQYGNSIAEHILLNYPYFYLAYVPIMFWLSAFICRKFAPQAAGGGTEQVIEALKLIEEDKAQKENQHAIVRKYLGKKVAAVKAMSSVLLAAGGGALGREGPTIQITASFFSSIGRRVSAYFPEINIGAWIIAGSAAGLAAAFNTPLAGVIFAIEELTELHLSKLGSYLYLAVIGAGLTSLSIDGHFLVFQTHKNIALGPGFTDLLAYVLVGVLCGLLAIAFRKISNFVRLQLTNMKFLGWHVIPLACGLIVGGLTFLWGPRSTGGGIYFSQKIIEDSLNNFTPWLVMVRFLNIAFSALSGAAGGLLAPSLGIGAGLGALFAKLIATTTPLPLILSGMAAFLAAMLRSPFTATVLIMEMTNQHDIILVLLISCLISTQVTQRFYKNT